MSKKKLKIWSVIIAFVISFGLHFLYDLIPCFVTSIIAPVNESIWEHMKILFTSIILSAAIQKIILKKKKIKYNNICFSNFVGAFLSIPIYLLIYLPIYNMIGDNMIFNIVLLFIVIVISQVISLYFINKNNFKLENATIIFVLAVYFIFGLLTYKPIKVHLFFDTTNNTYGIPKEKN